MLTSKQISRIIITKPIVEAGDEKIGFLPGDINEKIGPHFQYLIDKIEDIVGPMACERLIKSKAISFCPTAYLRGRDFKYSFIFVDEAQNMTVNGLKLLMTRLGEGSQMVIAGDSDQIDLKNRSDSGFDHVVSRLRGRHSDISVIDFSTRDICRHPLITDILNMLG
jgi:phosphate starvation-inducible PhoH-like protein